MDNIQALKAQVISKLSHLHIDLIDEFSPHPMSQLSDKPLVCIYLKGLHTNGGMLGDLLKTAEIESGLVSTYGQRAVIRLGFTIYCRTAQCDATFSDVATALVFDDELHVRSINCLSMEYDNSLKLYVLQGEMEMDRMLATVKHEKYIRTVRLDLSNNIRNEVAE